MGTTTDPSRKNMNAAQRLNPLGAVLWWEVRRYVARPANMVIAFGTFALMFGLFLSVRGKATFIEGDVQNRISLVVPFAAIGITMTVFTYLIEFVGLYLPFINADVVSGDLQRRTHALLMATALPTWAYVWGRYLYGVLLSLGLAALALPAYLLASVVIDGSLATLNFRGVLVVWVLNVLCPVVFLSGLGFAFGTLLPHFANLVKVLLLLGWLTIFIILRRFEMQSWEAWDPTSAAWVDLHLDSLYGRTAGDGIAALSAKVQVMPDVSSLVLPHVTLALIGLGATLIAALSFRRFREAAV